MEPLLLTLCALTPQQLAVATVLLTQLQTHMAYLIHVFLISCGLPHFLALIFGNPPCLLGDHI